MTGLSDRIDALAQHGERLRRIGARQVLAGCCLGFALFAFYWPDPAGGEALYQYISVPQPLFTQLREHGAGVRDIAQGLLPGVTIWWTIGILPLFIAIHFALRRFIRQRAARYVIMTLVVITSPSWLLSAPTFETLPGARIGIVVDHAGAPAAAADGTSRPPVPAYRLTLAGLSQRTADQARFVLAQQAYLEGDPARVAAYLDGMTGSWQPRGRDQLILGLMVDHAAANGHAVRGAAVSLADGAAQSFWRRLAYSIVRFLAICCCGAGIIVFVIGDRRLNAATRHRRTDRAPEFALLAN